jgi:hypothetical protein
MNKYSESVINNFTDSANVDKVFSELRRRYIAEYGPSTDIDCILNSGNNRARMINSYVHREKMDLMYIGVKNPRVEDQVKYMNVQFISEHLPLLYEMSKRASNGWGGIDALASKKINDQYSVSGRSIVSDANREVLCDTNTHQSKYINGQVDNKPWKSPEQLSRESANKTLESWRYNTRPRELRDDRVGTINLTPDTYGGMPTSETPGGGANIAFDTFNNVGYSRKMPKGLDRGFAANYQPNCTPQLARQLEQQRANAPRSEGFAGGRAVSAVNIPGQTMSNGGVRFNTCSQNPGEHLNGAFTDYIGPNVGTGNGMAIGNKWMFSTDLRDDQAKGKNAGKEGGSMSNNIRNGTDFVMDGKLYTGGKNRDLGGGLRSTISCANIGNTGINAQTNMNTPGRSFNAVGDVDFGGETYDGVDLEEGTTYGKNDVPHLPTETQQHYRQLLDAPYMHLLNSGQTPDLDPGVGNARKLSYRTNTEYTNADDNYKIPTNEYPLQPKYRDIKKAPMVNSRNFLTGVEYDSAVEENPSLKGKILIAGNSKPTNKSGDTPITNSANKSANKSSDSIIQIKKNADGKSVLTINIGSGNKSANSASNKPQNKPSERFSGSRPSSIIPDPITCSSQAMPGGVYPGGGLNGYKSPCFTFDTNISDDLSGDTGNPLNMPDPHGNPNKYVGGRSNILRPVESGQFMEQNRPKLWTDGAGFVDQTDPNAMQRLLQRRSFRTYGDIATGKYIEQTDKNIGLDVFWTGEIYNNQTPFWQKSLHARRYDYDAEEAVGGFEMGNFQRGYDMDSLKCRVDAERKSYGKFNGYKKW